MGVCKEGGKTDEVEVGPSREEAPTEGKGGGLDFDLDPEDETDGAGEGHESLSPSVFSRLLELQVEVGLAGSDSSSTIALLGSLLLMRGSGEPFSSPAPMSGEANGCLVKTKVSAGCVRW